MFILLLIIAAGIAIFLIDNDTQLSFTEFFQVSWINLSAEWLSLVFGLIVLIIALSIIHQKSHIKKGLIKQGQSKVLL